MGHWTDPQTLASRRRLVACGDGHGTICRERSFARIGDNMRSVAVTEGDKVSAEVKFGFSVNGYGIGDVVKFRDRSK